MSDRRLNIVLWVLQVVLAALFLFAGITKLVTPIDALAKQAHMNGTFLRFIGVVETLGGLGLILPGIFRIRQELTPLAAAGLTILMIGAVVVTVMQGGGATVLIPAVTGVLCAFVAYGRWRMARPAATRA
ncbi:MAG TPA: DoxX family protein, partial [Thermoanaerobaculia bacterium]